MKPVFLILFIIASCQPEAPAVQRGSASDDSSSLFRLWSTGSTTLDLREGEPSGSFFLASSATIDGIHPYSCGCVGWILGDTLRIDCPVDSQAIAVCSFNGDYRYRVSGGTLSLCKNSRCKTLR